MRIATWNVNSIRARLERVLAWLERDRPDVACLQEIKATEEQFPFEAIERAGYHAAVYGQKTYNGVAILSPAPPDEVVRGLQDGQDPDARLLAARFGELWAVNVYVPNGATVGSDKWAYKLRWLAELRRWLDARFRPEQSLALCGDFNVAPEDRDVHDPERWAETVLCHPKAREALEEVRRFGFVDAFRRHHEEGGLYTWWDYRGGAFWKNHGLRIDHVWATRPLAARSVAAHIDRDERKGKGASDHVPLVVDFDLAR